MKKNKNEDFLECYYVLQEQIVRKHVSRKRKGIVKAGSESKKGKRIVRAGYGNKMNF